MNRFDFSRHTISPATVNKVDFISGHCQNKNVLDMGCVQHSAEFAIKSKTWLHKNLKNVSKKIVGVDYLESEVKKLQDHGYNVIHGDVTKPLNLNEKFDVIVAGDLIEHLNNFEGFFNNCGLLLNKNGRLLISTPNPFYYGTFHFLAFKKTYFVNPEHTCWIDPLCLKQLAERFNFEIEVVHFVSHSWPLQNFILDSRNHSYDMLNGRFENNTISFKIARRLTQYIFGGIYAPFKLFGFCYSRLVRHSDYIAVLKFKEV